MDYFYNLLYFSKFLHLGGELPGDGVNDAETRTKNVRLYLYLKRYTGWCYE